MKNKLMIIGASGHGKVVAEVALKMNNWESIVFLDDDEDLESPLDLRIIGTSDEVLQYIDDYEIFVGVGNNTIREEIQDMLEEAGASIPTLIHPTSVIGEHVIIEAGTVIMAGAVINCCSNIGRGCIINTSSTIDHDNSIEDYVHVSPGAHLAGSVTVGKKSWLGIGSIVSNNVNITSGCKVGAGAVVIKDVTEPGVYVGVPVRRV